MKIALMLLLCALLSACFPTRPDTAQGRVCASEARAVADKRVAWADPWWPVFEGQAYDACMARR